MNTNRKANLYKVLTLLAIFAMVFGLATPAFAQGEQYPLTGMRGDPSSPEFDVIWEANGRLWQDKLVCTEGKSFTVAFEIMPGDYIFNGKEAELYVDDQRNGKGMSNPVTVKYGNDLKFTVKTTDGKSAWAVVYGKGNRSCGFDIWATPQYGTSSALAAATSTPTATVTPLPTFTPTSSPSPTASPVVENPTVTPMPSAIASTQNPDVILQRDITVTNNGLQWFLILALVALVLFLAFRRPVAAPAPTIAPKATVRRKSATKKSKTTKK